MIYNHIHNTDLEVSSIGLGTWVFGGDVWQGSKEDDCINAVHAAIDCGISLIDTAPIYGNGLSEQIVGKAINGKREKVIIATKCGLTLQGDKVIGDLSRDAVIKEVDQSLSRLNIDTIDIYQCHWPDEKTPIEETMVALNELVQAGKIRYIGVSNFDKSLLEQARSCADVVTLQSEYSLLSRDLENEAIPYCEAQGVGILAYGVLGGGILTGKYKQEPRFKGADARNFFYKHYKGNEFKKVQKFLKLVEGIDKPLNQTALNWIRQQKSVVSVLVGCRNADQVHKNVESADWSLSNEELSEIAGMKV